jgi:hypothetical protein
MKLRGVTAALHQCCDNYKKRYCILIGVNVRRATGDGPEYSTLRCEYTYGIPLQTVFKSEEDIIMAQKAGR